MTTPPTPTPGEIWVELNAPKPPPGMSLRNKEKILMMFSARITDVTTLPNQPHHKIVKYRAYLKGKPIDCIMDFDAFICRYIPPISPLPPPTGEVID